MLLGLDVLVSPSCCVGNYVVCIVELGRRKQFVQAC